ncbi:MULTISPECIES: hypothetical protein [unclassified Rhizobium]|uniref:DUF7878 domain-containing protein n=1 Tax=unclassified Rhizobium TaxID=2613769 RepID=UPI000714CBC0|nr:MULTISPECIES: hypothetical protein [unclassified Rhizobium]KQS87696.1 hypothetical protein ASG42_19990 [Rhizobium sp. Leaf391]KQT07132.1 hypothetical protein ASG50_01535 [Rhizobium sp. Leaf386]KQT95258.1 hypothetical protein ASG68_14800 [Rhizobium sp. Leaf453]
MHGNITAPLDNAISTRFVMNFAFEIAAVSERSKGYRVITETSGKLKVVFGPDHFFRFNEILLVEFALYCFIWHREYESEPNTAFSYASMDEEEEPLLAFILQPNGMRTAQSCWSEFSVPDISNDALSKAVLEILSAFQTFTKSAFARDLESLASELWR